MLERSGRQNVRVHALLGRMLEMLIFEQRLVGSQHQVIREQWYKQSQSESEGPTVEVAGFKKRKETVMAGTVNIERILGNANTSRQEERSGLEMNSD